MTSPGWARVLQALWQFVKRLFGLAGSEPGPRLRLGAGSSGMQPGAAAPSSTTSAKRSDYEARGILGLSADEFRALALKINPYRTPWIGRVDTIPPQSDERTALIDRGLVLRGLLSEEALAEIHRVGDEWLKTHDAHRLAEALGKARAQELIEEHRRERAALKESRQREAAERRERRAREIAERRATDIVFAGRGVSHQLGNRRSDVAALEAAKLPVLSTPKDLADALGTTVPTLRWLAFHHDCPERTHYVYFTIPKRSGGTRLLASPKRQLRRAQRWVFCEVLAKLGASDYAHGFVSGRSTVTNAQPHVGRHAVVNLDLKDFFPSVTFGRIRGLFASLGYSPAVATLLALLCTEAPRTPVEFEGRKYWVAVRERALPQGACTSPALANLVCRKLDRRLAGASRRLGFLYTRYADDLTFSSVSTSAKLPLLLARARHIVRDEGFVVNEDKGRIQRRGGRQEVTGIVVNDQLGVRREEIRTLRAILHNAKTTGLSAQNRTGRPNFEAWLRGKIGYVTMVDPAKGRALASELDACGP